MAVGLKDLHSAMVADGLTKQSYDDFKRYLNAPGKQGYQNRLNTYKYLKNNGVDVGSYEDFKTTLGFHAVGKSAAAQSAAAVGMNRFGGGATAKQRPTEPSSTQTRTQGQAQARTQTRIQARTQDKQQPAASTMPNMTGTQNDMLQRVGQYEAPQQKQQRLAQQQRQQQTQAKARQTAQRSLPATGDVENIQIPYRPTQSEYQNMMARGRQQMRSAIEGNDSKGARLVQKANHKVQQDLERKYAEGNELQTYKDSKGKTHTLYGSKNNAQIQQDLNDFANQELKRSGVVDAVDAIQKQKEGEANQFMQDNASSTLLGGQSAAMFNVDQSNRIQSPDAIFQESLDNMNAYLKANEKRYADMAKRFGFKSTKDFVEGVVAPKLYNSMSQRFDENMMKKYSPKSIGEYIANGLGDSVLGTLVTVAGDRSTRQWQQQAQAATEEGQNPYGVKAGKVAKLTRMGVSFAADAPIFVLTGGLGNAAAGAVTRGVLDVGGRAAAQYGAETAARVTGFIASNSGKVGKAAELLGSVTGGAVNLGAYNTISGEAQALANATDWTSLGQGTLAALQSGVEGATTGALLGASGKFMGDLTSKWGVKPGAKGKELAKGMAQGAGAAASRFAVESGVFASADQFNNWMHGRQVDWSPENFAESAEQLMVMKLTGARPFSKMMQRYADTKARMQEAMQGMNDTEKNVYLQQMRDRGIIMPGWNGSIGDYVKGMGKFSARQLGETLSTELQSLYAKESPLKLTEDEKQTLTENTNASNVRDAILSMVSEKGMKESPMGERRSGESNEAYDARVQQLSGLVDNYKEFMADKSVPWTLKEKIGFALGSPMSGKPRMFKTDVDADNTVTTYAEDGQVIDRKKFKTEDEARAFEQSQREQRDSEDLWKAVTLLGNKRPDEKDYANAANDYLTQIGYGKDAATDSQIEEALKNPDSPITAGLRQATGEYNPLNSFLTQWSVKNGVSMNDILDVMYNGAKDMAGETIRMKLKDDMEDYMQSGNVYDPYEAMRVGSSRADEHLDNPDQPNGDGIKAETQRWNDAQKAFDDLLKRNDVVKGLYGDGSKDDNELLEALKAEDDNVVSQDDMDAVVRYLNARTRYNAYMDAMQDKIEDAASRARNEAIFNGKDGNGNPFGLPINDENGKPMDGVMDAALVYATDADGNQVLVRDGVVRDNGDGTYSLENVKDNAGNDTGIVIVKDMLGNVKYASAADLKIDMVSDTKDFHDSYVKALQELVSSYASRPEEHSDDGGKAGTNDKPAGEEPKGEDVKEGEGSEPTEATGERGGSAEENVPDWTEDKPEEARKRGFWIVGKMKTEKGQRIDRQTETKGVYGNDVTITFGQDSKDKVKGRVKVIEAYEGQPSHLKGQSNPRNFIPEGQPKDRTDNVSRFKEAQLASNIIPEEITDHGDYVSPYQTSAPTVNQRGEGVQGNNRLAVLRYMYENYPEQAKKYKQYLIDHAAEWGLDPDAIKKMDKPILVNEIDVDDAEAIRLGQKAAADNESGGEQHLDPKRVIETLKVGKTKAGKNLMESFLNLILRDESKEDKSVNELIRANGQEVLKWLHGNGVINDTQLHTALDKEGKLSRDGLNDLTDILEALVFDGAPQGFDSAFRDLPSSIQKMILRSMPRDLKSEESKRIKGDIQSAVMAFTELNKIEAFRKAKAYEQARKIAEGVFLNQTNIFNDVEGEKYNALAIELACRMRASKSGVTAAKELSAELNRFFDLVQGFTTDIFETVKGKQSFKDAVKEVFGVDIEGKETAKGDNKPEGGDVKEDTGTKENENDNGQGHGTPMAGNGQGGKNGKQDESGTPGSGEQTTGGEGPSVSGGGAESVGGTVAVARPELGEKPLTEEEIDSANVSRTIKNYAKGFLAGTNTSELAKAFYNRVYRAVRGKEEKPTDKPVDEPADKPNEPKTPTDGGKPVDKPNDKPTQKPAGGKAEKPKEDTGEDKPKEGDQGQSKGGSGSGLSRIKDILGQMGRLHGDKPKSDDQTDKYSMEGMGDEDIDLMAQLVDAGAQAAYDGMKDGSIKSSDDFVKQVVDLIGDPLKQYYHYTEDDVKDVVKDMWNGEYQDESGKVQTIAKWAKELNVEDKINSNEASSSNVQGDAGERPSGSPVVGGAGAVGGEAGGRADSGAAGQDTGASGPGDVQTEDSGSQGQERSGVGSVLSEPGGGLRGNLQPVPGEGRGGKSSTHDSEGATGTVGGVHPTRPVRGADSVGRDARIDLAKEKTPYVSASDESGTHSIGSVMPSGAATAVKNAFDRLVARVKKQVKDFVRDELGYSSDEEMFSDYEHGKETGLSGEQVDGVGLAIDAMQQGRSFIIGDMTGVGKGRQGAAIIRWGLQHKKRVIFITEKRDLFTDMYRDLSDIGMEGVNPFCINTSDKKADILDKDGNIVIKHPTTQAQKALWQTDKTELPRDKNGKPYNFIMMTYDDAVARTRKGSEDTSKQDWLKTYAKDAIIVMDESHNASGNSQRSDYLRDLVKEAGGVTFMSATYAKRPDNMLLYAIRSSMSKANVSEEDMLNAIRSYGVPLQEILANALFNNGEMIRRERDFTGVKTHWTKPEEVYTKEEVEATRHTTDAITDLVNDIIDFQRQYVNPIVNRHEKELQVRLAALPPQLRPNEHYRNSPYSGQVSNVMNLIVYGLKADKAASMAIEQLKAGKKPVIAVENTLGSYVNDMDNGTVDDVSFSNVLRKGVDFALRYKHAVGSKKDEKTHKTNSDYKEEVFNAEDELDDVGKATLASLRSRIEAFANDKNKVELTISPIDYIKRKIEEAGFSVGEITGRTSRIVKNADGTYTKEPFKTDKKEAARRFNGGSVTTPLSKEDQLNALIVNVAGATGISLHASKGFGNQDPRTMIILQPARNVNTEVQMRGRIDRTGQVSRGEYFYLTSPIPVEQKVTMMLRKKLSSLDANTVGNKDVKSNTVDATDMDNKYGDQVALEFLQEHLNDINAFLDKSKAIQQNKMTGEWEGHEGLLYDLLIAAQRMPCSEQEYIINELTSRYVDQINYLNENGINDLETSTMNLDATTVDSAVFVPGSDNNSDNIFAKDTNIERVEVNVLKKPVKSDEIRKRMIKLGIISREDGEDYYNSNWGQKIYSKVLENTKKQRDDKLAQQKAKMDAELVRARKLVKRQDGESDADYEDRVNHWPSVEELRMNQEAEYKAFDLDLNNQENAVYRAAVMYLQPGRGYLIPLSDDVTNNPQSMYGRFIGIEYKGGKPRTAKAIFATKDSRSIVSIPIVTKSRLIDYIHSIANDTTFQEIEEGHDGDALGRIKAYDEWWDKMIPKNTSRTIRYMITGNVLQAAGKLGKYKGQIVTFTRKNKETGEVTVDHGMLLSEDFDPEDFAIKSPITYDDVMGSNETIHDDDANISVSHQGDYMLVEIYKRKGQSLKNHPIYKDDEFKALTNRGDYDMYRESFDAWIPKKNAEKALQILRDKYHLSKTTMFVMPDSTDRVDKIVPSGKRADDVIKDFSEKYGIHSAMSAQLKIDSLKKRFKMDVNNEELKQQIKELVQLRQAYLRKDNAREPDDRLGWELLIQEGRAAHATGKRERETAHNTAEAIKEEFEARGLKGTEMHLKNGRSDLKSINDLFTKLNKNKDNQKIYEKVMEKMNTIGDKMKIIFDEEMDNEVGGAAGGALLHYNSKYFNSKWVTDQGKADTLLHEMIHTLTVYAKRCVDNGWEYLLDDDMVTAVHELDDIFNVIRNDKAFDHPTFRQYGTKNWAEMLAEFGSNPSFREDTKKVSLWARIRDGFLRFFGFKKDGARETKAYDAIGDRLMDLITSFNEHAWEEAYRGTSVGVNSQKQESRDTDVRFRRNETFGDGQQLNVSYHLTSIYPSKGRWHVEGLNSEYSTPDAMLDAFRNKYPSYFATLSQDKHNIVVEPWSKYIGKSNASQEKKARDTRRATQAIEHMCGALHLDNVDVKFSNKGLNADEQGAKGWFNKRTGQITINLANHADIEDVKRTILHEGVAHYGLRKMFGESFDNFLDNVYENATDSIKAEIGKMTKDNGYDQRTATEEYLASLAEDTNFDRAMEQGWWGRIKFAFVKMLAKAGFKVGNFGMLEDADLRYMLWRSYENLKEPEKYQKEGAAAKQQPTEPSGTEGREDARGRDAALKGSAQNGVQRAADDGIGDIIGNEGTQAGSDILYRKRGGDRLAVETTQKVAEKLGERYNTKVDVATKPADISDPYYRRQVENGDKDFKGWYDEKDGSVHIYAPNISSKHDAERVVWHETVGHKGMRQLLGEEGYHKYMKALWTDAEQRTDGLHAFVEKNLWSRGRGNLYDTIDEYLADAAEKGNAATDLWMAVRDKISDVLRKLGFDTTPSIKDVKYMVWLSKHQLKKGQPLDEMKHQWILNRIDHQTDKNPDYQGRQFTDEGWPKGMESARAIRESQETTYHPSDTPSENFAREDYERRLKRASYVWKEAYVDYMQAAQELIESVTDKKIKDLDPNENFVMAENHLDSENEQQDFNLYHNYFKPLDESIAKVICNFTGDTSERLRQLQLYMVQKHGLERNRVFFVRDFTQAMESKINPSDPAAPTQDGIDTLRSDFNGLRAQLKDQLDKGAITLRDYCNELDNWITTNLDPEYKASEHDYSGLSEMQNGRMADGRVQNGYDEDKVLADVMDTEDMLGKDVVKDLWDKTKACTDYGLDYEYQSGLDTKEQVERVKGMFDWYVPLRGYDDTTAEEMYGYVGNEHGAWVGPALMAAKGRRSTADIDIFATIGAMCSSAIQRGGRNKMKQVFARFIRNHYDAAKSLVVETKVWSKKETDAKGNTVWTEQFPDLKEGMSADDIAKTVSDFNKDMEALKAKGEAKEIRSKGAKNLIFTKPDSKNQHIVDVWINGQCHRFVVCGNPRAAQAVNGLTRPVNSNNKLAGFVRIMSQLNTSYSPDFIMRNTLRDATFAATNIAINESPVYLAKYEKNYARVMGRMLGGMGISKINHNSINLFERYRNGKLNMSNELDRYFKEFMENGGETGWVESKNVEKWKGIIEKGVKDQQYKAAKVLRNISLFIPELIETMNERAENLARFATYVTSRESGRTVRKSIADAKEVSVNFNRKGSGKKALDLFPQGKATRNGWWAANTAQYFRSSIMFFGAGMQGLNTLAKNMSFHPAKTSAAMAAFVAGGFLAPMLNAFLQAVLDGDDDTYKDSYAELPEWVRRNNFCIYAGKGSFITVPNAIETRAFYGIGDLMASKLTHKELDNGKNVVMDMTSQLSQVSPLDPFGESSGYWVNTFVPSYVRPVLEDVENTNWIGIPLERERASYNANDPRWTLAYSGTSELLKSANKKVNAATNDVEGVPEEEDAMIQGNQVADYATDPALVQHLVEGYLGGMGTTLTRMSNIARDAMGGKGIGEILGSNNMPILRTVHFEPTEQNSSMRTRTKYFDYVKKYTNLRADAMKLAKQGTNPFEHLTTFGQNAALTRAQMGKVLQTNNAIKKLNKQLSVAKNDEEKARINQLKNRLMKEAVEFVDKTEAYKSGK